MKILFLSTLLLTAHSALAQELPAERQAALKTLLHQDCGACHGMTLRGGLGPALLPEALKEKPVELLTATILLGRPGTAMPPWNVFLSAQEAEWLAAYLKQTEQGQ